MLQKSLTYSINKFLRFYRVPEKNVILKKSKNNKIGAMDLSSDCFVKNFFFIQYFDYLCKDSRKNWVFALLSGEMHGWSTGQGLTLLPMENYQVFL